MGRERHHPLGIPSASTAGMVFGDTRGARVHGGAVLAIDRWLLRRIARACGSPPVEFSLWNDLQRPAREGLEGRVEFVDDDSRNITGEYDAFVSIGMLEHVGLENDATLGGAVDSVLARGGLALVHTVGRDRPSPPNAWLEQRIFPGSHPPSLGEVMRICAPYRFTVIDVENLRLHYVRALTRWLVRFEAHEDTVRGMYDERFARAWRLYLAGCAASFLAGNTHLYQMVVARPGHHALPLTREHLYRGTLRAVESWCVEGRWSA